MGIFYDSFEGVRDINSFDLKFYVLFVSILLTLSLFFLNFLILYEVKLSSIFSLIILNKRMKNSGEMSF